MDDSGAQLRAARIDAGVGLDAVARAAAVSKGHLSRVERGERPVTPATVLAYERALGYKLTYVSVAGPRPVPLAPRKDDDMQRRTLLAGIIATATGTAASKPLGAVMSGWHGSSTPAAVSVEDITDIERAAMSLTTRDLQGGSYAAVSEGRALLDWAIGLRDRTMTAAAKRRLESAAGYLADRTGWAAFDAGWHDQARRLFGVGLRLADEADNANLTAQILCDMSGHAVFCDKPADALAYTQLALRDERVVSPLRAALYGVTAEAYGRLGDTDGVHRHIDLALDTVQAPVNEAYPVWMSAFRGAPGLNASTGYAAYLLHQRTGATSDADLAIDHTLSAATALGIGRSRSATLCTLRAATVHLASPAGDRDRGIDLAQEMVATMSSVRSTRTRRELTALRAALPATSTDRRVGDLDAQLATLLAGPARV